MTQKQDGILNVCFCFTDTSGSYYRHPLVALTSVFENTRAGVRAHILCDETVAESSKKAFATLAERYGQEAVIYAVPAVPQDVAANIRACFGTGSVFRLFLPELIQQSLVLYLDCDIACNMDIAEIFRTNMDSLPVTGVPDSGLRDDPKSAHRLRSMGLEPNYYVNSGVMLWNLDKLRNEYPDCKDAVFANLAEKKLKYPDQDALNMYFQHRGQVISVLPTNYNYMIGIEDRAYLAPFEYAGKILHYTRDKPWNALYPAALYYWKYYAIAFSCQEAFAGMEKLGKSEYAYLYNFLLRKPKIRRMLNRLWQIAEQGVWETILDRLSPGRRKKKRRDAGAS